VARDRTVVLAILGTAAAAALAACGSSSTPGATASVPLATGTPPVPTATAASTACPTGASVGSALGGITLPNATGVAGGVAGAPLPAGATAEVCEYHASTYNVIIELLSGISPSYISNFSSRFPVPYTTVPGVGDQARSFEQPLGGGKDNEGVVASKGSNMVSITATDTPASLAQVEALVTQLL